jgi:hypothetical protein
MFGFPTLLMILIIEHISRFSAKNMIRIVITLKRKFGYLLNPDYALEILLHDKTSSKYEVNNFFSCIIYSI